MGGSFRAGDEDIWEAVLGLEVRIPGEDIWMSGLELVVRISAPGKDI